MELDNYVQEALVTESKISKVKADPELLLQSLAVFSAAGSLLDMIKKNVFYGKPIDPVKWDDALYTLHGGAVGLRVTTHGTAAYIQDIETNPRLFHAIVGIATESAELIDALYQQIDEDKPHLDTVNIQEELGDLAWYQAIAVDEMGASWGTILDTNIKKLRARNKGNSFNAEATINRDVEAERKILEGGASQ